MPEHCAICGCPVHRSGDYAKPTILGRSHATEHHFVAERFFGRSKNRPGEQRERIFQICPWGLEQKAAIYCYECHEELLHNPVLTPVDVDRFAALVRARGLAEREKAGDRALIAGRIQLFQEVISAGLATLTTPSGGNSAA